MKGLVLKSTGSWYEVLGDNDRSYTCRTRGKLRLKGFKTTNPIAVGDYVVFSLDEEVEGQGVIDEILPRENYIIRKSVKLKSQGHIIASNIDQAILIVTLAYPRTSLGFIDRFLVTAESFRIPQVLIFNKIDLLDGDARHYLAEIRSLYENIGIQCLEVSALTETGIEDVKDLLKGKKSLISGHSGVGKSTLINKIAPEINQKTGEVSDYAEKGIHTTTFAEMFRIGQDTFIIDTPGIKELGIIDIDKEELSDYFPEMRALQPECKFHNCTHTHEPKCAVKDAVDEGEIAESRYMSYLSILEGDDNRR
ncbi:Ribosome small subunit-stimulated GTPase EngC [Fulvivirga imtechensis AK7]|uniref:Small ribosomal subunit biogenesis GTPase RsgA n=1 Tax=Fulvivirga imtechensis AK7 TaxID=1237149 RepID=L8JSP6_9BACT|nr:ribosome small subunit-dependent GTPase A [Fulvivirga imtechensis]ELR70382.1 Ribosome small subunit-stimulated GTPase EngC [Fulvivirga imtechensis AK7]